MHHQNIPTCKFQLHLGSCWITMYGWHGWQYSHTIPPCVLYLYPRCKNQLSFINRFTLPTIIKIWYCKSESEAEWEVRLWMGPQSRHVTAPITLANGPNDKPAEERQGKQQHIVWKWCRCLASSITLNSINKRLRTTPASKRVKSERSQWAGVSSRGWQGS